MTKESLKTLVVNDPVLSVSVAGSACFEISLLTEFKIHCLVPVWPWPNYLISLVLFPHLQNWIIIVPME